jgi:hypothetical protein
MPQSMVNPGPYDLYSLHGSAVGTAREGMGVAADARALAPSAGGYALPTSPLATKQDEAEHPVLVGKFRRRFASLGAL